MREVLVVVQEGAVHVDGGQAQVSTRVTRGVSGGRHVSIVPDRRAGCSRPTTRPGQPHAAGRGHRLIIAKTQPLPCTGSISVI